MNSKILQDYRSKHFENNFFYLSPLILYFLFSPEYYLYTYLYTYFSIRYVFAYLNIAYIYIYTDKLFKYDRLLLNNLNFFIERFVK